MKKLVLIFGLAILLGGENVFADEGFKCAEPTQARLGVSNITGVNPLAEQIANAIITKHILAQVLFSLCETEKFRFYSCVRVIDYNSLSSNK